MVSYRGMIFGRIVTAMVTPFSDNDEVDYDEAIRLGEYLCENGTDTILLSGTTGESPTLTHNEEFRLYKELKLGLKGKNKIIAGTGSNCTRTAIASTIEATKIGVDGILQVVPYYNKPSQEGLYQHFKAVAESTHLPIMLYNIPGRTGKNLEPETAARLADIPNITSIKEAAGDVNQVKQLKALCDLEIYCGDDALTLDFMENGAGGVVSVASHIVGNEIKQMISLFLEGDQENARKIESTLLPIFEALFIAPNPVPVKAALRNRGFKVGKPRLPLVDLTTDQLKYLRSKLNHL